MPLATLSIQPEPLPEPGRYRFRLQGVVDVDAVPALAPLYELPAEVEVELDFAQVQRVNSMGLAQLLKLFEHWQGKGIAIRVANANRMTAMLFKMTGLDRFLSSASEARPAKAAPAREPRAEDKRRFALQGVLDIDAVTVLEPMYQVPAESEVELDFAQVQRVNSMGLAQLLKLFEHWRQQRVRIRVSNVNRMTAMLFKMTGLDRFLVAESAPQAVLAVNGGVATRTTPVAPAPPPRPQPPAGSAALYWQVHMPSSQQLNGWYFFNTYLQRQLARTARLEIADSLLSGRDKPQHLPDFVYTKPFDAVRLITRHGFQALARSSNQSDEVTILARAEDARTTLSEFAGGRVAATAPDNFVYLLGRYLLDEAGLPSGSLGYQFAGHEIKAVQMLLKGEADLLFMHSESFQRLSGMTRRLLRELDHSEAQFAFHLWCLAPQRADLADPLRELLLTMQDQEQGRKVLAELGYTGWMEPVPEDIAMLERIYTLYGEAG